MSASTPPKVATAPCDWLEDYPLTVGRGDLYAGAQPAVQKLWTAAAKGLARLAEGSAASFQEQVDRQIQDVGLTFRMTGDAEERDWPLNAMPLVVGAEEWGQVERGLVQRAHLLEAVAADIYGEQKLVREGHLPAALLAGSPYFARAMVGLKPLAKQFLHVYAADLARGPDGQWRVLGDRLRLANGVGYALENRLAIARSTGSLLGDMHVRRMGGFFGALRDGIAQDCGRENPRIALLTPGRLNQSHAEQAYLARYLGFPLVEGRDLVVQDDRLYLRTIAGPKRIDALWRWLDTNALDPLSFDARSSLGVPGLYGAWARGGLEVANWPGVEVLEARAFAAFLPRLFPLLLGEEPLLPNIATWWCGQPGEAAHVRDRLDELVIEPAFGQRAAGLPHAHGAVPGNRLPPAQREALLAAMQRRPMDFCGQEIVQLSTTPALIDGVLRPRPFTLRAFVVRTPDGGWSVMPGGFARLSSSGALLSSLMGSGDLSADVWVADNAAAPRPLVASSDVAPTRRSNDSAVIRRGGGILASQAADNLFWFGRYAERAEATTRVLQALLSSTVEMNGEQDDAGVAAILVKLLVDGGALAPAAAKQPLAHICAAVLSEARLSGGLASINRAIHDTGLALRQRFARDFWRIANRPLPRIADQHPQPLLQYTKDLLLRFSAMAGQVSENMTRGPAWVFLDLGRRLERAVTICRLVQVLWQGSDDAADSEAQSDPLNMLLDLCDAQVTYRARYLTGALAYPVLDLLLLDPYNPRSLVFQLERIAEHLATLPALADNLVPEPAVLAARAALAPWQTLSAREIGPTQLRNTENSLLALSNTISLRYFLPTERSETITGSLLA